MVALVVVVLFMLQQQTKETAHRVKVIMEELEAVLLAQITTLAVAVVLVLWVVAQQLMAWVAMVELVQHLVFLVHL